MTELTGRARAAVKEFMSKEEFDFSTAKGWREFMQERTASNRYADGVHNRDRQNYYVHAMDYAISDETKVIVRVRRGVGQQALHPGKLFVYAPNSSWMMTTHVFDINKKGWQDMSFRMGGRTAPLPNGTRPSGSVGMFYLLVLPEGDVPKPKKRKGKSSIQPPEWVRKAAKRGNLVAKTLNSAEPTKGWEYDVSVSQNGGKTFERPVLLPQDGFVPWEQLAN